MDYNKVKREELKKVEEMVIRTFDDVLKSKTFTCSIYLLKYINDQDEKYFNKFIMMFRNFTIEEQLEVMNNVRGNLIEKGVINSKHV